MQLKPLLEVIIESNRIELRLFFNFFFGFSKEVYKFAPHNGPWCNWQHVWFWSRRV